MWLSWKQYILPCHQILSAEFLDNHFTVFSNFFECLLAPMTFFGGDVLKSYKFKFVGKNVYKSCTSTLFSLFSCLVCSPKSVTKNLQPIFLVCIHFIKPYYTFIYGRSLEISITLQSIMHPHKDFNNYAKSLCKALQVIK